VTKQNAVNSSDNLTGDLPHERQLRFSKINVAGSSKMQVILKQTAWNFVDIKLDSAGSI